MQEGEEGGRRLTERDAEGDRRGGESPRIAGRPCQSHRAAGTRDVLLTEDGLYFELGLSLNVILRLSSLWVAAWREESTCMTALFS